MTLRDYGTRVRELIDAYRAEYARIGRSGLNEAETRIRFLDNWFAALGWDLGEPESRRVRVEPRHREGFPDYSFLLQDEEVAFFVEAKRASDPANGDFFFTREEIFQAKGYAYANGVPFVVLSNFALTMVFAITRPPELLLPHDQEISHLRLTLDAPEARWQRFAEFLSRIAVDSGRILELLAATPVSQREPVTIALLKRLLDWRQRIASAYLALNPEETSESLDAAAVALLDKLLFAKILIDRELEPDFFSSIVGSPSISEALERQFDRLNDNYNGSIFARRPDRHLEKPEAAISLVVKSLAAKGFPFFLAHMPVEILGDIYETFIGIRLVREKSKTSMKFDLREDVKKQNGVYFTPKPYVDLMVDRVLRNRLDGISYSDLIRLKIVDPACGSGTFLIAAYRMLLDAALSYWKAQPAGPRRRKALHTYEGSEALTITFRREILVSCIHGVDRDKRALDIAALSLYLILLENDSRQGVLIAGTALPSLDKNLCSGNALVQDRTVSGIAIDWETLYPKVFSNGGFDIVLANPPYVFGEWLSAEEKQYLRRRFSGIGEQMDLYAAFLELAVTALCKPGGTYAFIVPDAILAREQRAGLRRTMLDNARPRIIAHVGTVFTKLEVASISQAKLCHNSTGVSAVIIIGIRGSRSRTIEVVEESDDGLWSVTNSLPVARVRADVWNRFLIYVRPGEWPIFEVLAREAVTLGDVLQVAEGSKGISRGEECGKRNLKARPVDGVEVPLIPGEAIASYHLGPERYFVAALQKPGPCYAAPKILVRKTDDRLLACREDDGDATLQSVYNVQIEPSRIDVALALLNSRFSQWFFKRTVTQYKKLMPQITQGELLTLPFPRRHANYRDLVSAVVEAAADKAAGLNGPATRRFGALYERIESLILADLGIEAYGQMFAEEE